MVVIKCDWLLKKLNIIFSERVPLSLSKAIFNLLDEKKAISIPEKKAEKSNDIKIIVKFMCQFNLNLFELLHEY